MPWFCGTNQPPRSTRAVLWIVLSLFGGLGAAALIATPAVSQSPPAIVVTFEEVARVPGQASGVTVAGKRAYVVGRTLDIVDVTDPADAARLGSVALPGRGERVDVAGDRAYVADGRQGLRIIDVADPAHPREVNHVPGDYTWDVEVFEPWAFTANGTFGFQIIDLTDPTVPPRLINWIDERYAPVALARADRLLYVAGWQGGAEILDPSTVSEANGFVAETVASVTAPWPVRDVAVAGDRAYLLLTGWDPYPAPGTDGRHNALAVVDATDPVSPTIQAILEGMQDGHAVAAAAGLAYVADGRGGLRAIDVADRRDPRLAGTFAAPDARDVALAGENVYVADREQGLIILRPHIGTPVPPTATSTAAPTATATPVHGAAYLPLGYNKAGR